MGGADAYTDGKTIHLPAMPSEVPDTLLAVVRGFLDHEAGPDLVLTKDALCQLSYVGLWGWSSIFGTSGLHDSSQGISRPSVSVMLNRGKCSGTAECFLFCSFATHRGCVHRAKPVAKVSGIESDHGRPSC